MFKRALAVAAATMAIGLGASSAAGAAVINFNSHTTYTAAGTSFSEGGMNFWGLELFFIPPDGMMPSPSTFDSTVTTPIMAASTEPVTMSLVSGAPFDLQSVDMGLGWYNLPGGDTETITGTKANCTDDGSGNCLVQDAFHVGYGFTTYTLSADFTDLSSVSFGAMTPQDFGGFTGSGWVGSDNITFSSPGEVGEPVPEPASWGLMILGFGAIGGLLRGRRRDATFTATS
ncbi:PEPxxWA-CTERM sorting domain-containing protein [Phenylobacterium sp.]|jgi:hypothetical protein|uniref:PEPxxWA-CTERM sorting domain-containing protein n=1 Tax=Phenylobacterium sp. TaxID=1871053 RepID=UPI002E37E6DC|nr:PEPxxWA-CTERM sorting domain-containing protein [Phenylobacterium sp.]HEX3365116.1 PEPxxWA-CTERM sorting domain-containing protein [Phenylobacterium sp.]